MAGGALRGFSFHVKSLALTFRAGGRKNVIPGAIMFTLFGATGQALYNMADARNIELAKATSNDKQKSWLDSKWSPVKVLSVQEYEEILREKLLRVNAQISLVDESMEALRLEQEREAAAEKGAPKSK